MAIHETSGAAAPDKRTHRALLIENMGRHADGDEAAFDVVFSILAPLVRGYHRRWVDEARADDLTQQTFLKVHRARDRYRRGSPVTPWVLAIARNVGIDALRKRGRNREMLTNEGLLPDQIVEPPADANALIAAVRDAIATLPEGQRAVVALHKLLGYSFAEVAAELGIREGAARVRAVRSYGRLRMALGAWRMS